MSPVAMTSERRKKTMLSPSVCADAYVHDLNAFAVVIELLVLP